MMWPAAVSEDYLALVDAGDDLSLLIFIHWCAIIYQSPRPWLMTAWTKRAALLAIGSLKRDWFSLLAWPIRVFDLVLPMNLGGPFYKAGQTIVPVPTEALVNLSLHDFPQE
jgi:hypothetical protein